MVLASTVVASMSAQTPAAGHLRVVDAPKFSAMPHAILLDTRVSRDARLLYGILQMYWWQGGECFASNAVLASHMACSDSQLRRYIGELIHAGHITSRMRGQGQAKAYAPTKPLPSDGKAYREPLTDERLNRAEVNGSDSNRSPVTGQPFTDDRFNRSPVTDPYKKTKEDSLKEEDSIVGGADAPRRPRKGTSERRASRLADDAALTDEHVQAAEAIGLSRTAASAEWAQFKDYHRAKGSTMLDWLAAWRTWCRNSLKFGARQKPMRGAKTQDTETPLKPTDMSRWSVRRYP